MDYNNIFCDHVTRLMHKKGLTKLELANLADISVSFISDLTNGKANPSLKVMTSIARALSIPLPLLLLDPDGEIWSLISACNDSSNQETHFDSKEISTGFEEVKAVLPSHRAFIVRQWASEVKKKRKKNKKV